MFSSILSVSSHRYFPWTKSIRKKRKASTRTLRNKRPILSDKSGCMQVTSLRGVRSRGFLSDHSSVSFDISADFRPAGQTTRWLYQLSSKRKKSLHSMVLQMVIGRSRVIQRWPITRRPNPTLQPELRREEWIMNENRTVKASSCC